MLRILRQISDTIGRNFHRNNQGHRLKRHEYDEDGVFEKVFRNYYRQKLWHTESQSNSLVAYYWEQPLHELHRGQ